jgi:3-hydroxyisobutyrate dehydrogenase-like beta-hydroxyacid dehydrogenase
MARAGVIGAGLMGTACVRRLIAAGLEVPVYDIDQAKLDAIARLGARPVASIAEIARDCTTLIIAVFSTDQVEQVVEGADGVLHNAVRTGQERFVICVSTCDPDRLAALAERVAPHGVEFLEVPISGTSRQVADGQGVGLIGGAERVVEQSSAVLDAICPQRHYLGAVGNGSRAKLAVNLILGLNRAALAEGLVFAERLGLDRSAFLDVARGSAAYSQAMDVKGPLMARREYRNPQSRVDQSLKDFRLMLTQAQARGQDLPFASLYAWMLEDCVKHGEAEWDNAAIAEALARRHWV